FRNNVMEGLSLKDRVELPFQNLLGDAPIAQSGDASALRIKFPTGDEIFVPHDLIWIFDHPEFEAQIRVALTAGNHALAGLLIHCACRLRGQQPFMLRLGAGQYPISLLSKILVERLNVRVGADLWPFTDQIVDYKRNPKVKPADFGK